MRGHLGSMGPAAWRRIKPAAPMWAGNVRSSIQNKMLLRTIPTKIWLAQSTATASMGGSSSFPHQHGHQCPRRQVDGLGGIMCNVSAPSGRIASRRCLPGGRVNLMSLSTSASEEQMEAVLRQIKEAHDLDQVASLCEMYRGRLGSRGMDALSDVRNRWIDGWMGGNHLSEWHRQLLASAIQSLTKGALEENALEGKGHMKVIWLQNILYVHAKLGLQLSQELKGRLRGLLESALAPSPDLTPGTVAVIIWALAKVKHQTSVILLQERALDMAQRFRAREISNILWAFSQMDVMVDPSLLDALRLQCLVCIKEFSSQTISNVLLAFGKLGESPGDKLLHALTDRSVAMMSTFEAQHVTNTLWAFATLAVRPSDVFIEAVKQHVVLVIKDCNSQAVANIFWSFTTLEVHPGEDLLMLLQQRAMQCIDGIKPQGIAMILVSFAKLKERPSDQLLDGLQAAANTQIDDFEAQSLTNLLWAFATMGVEIEPSLKSVIETKAQTLTQDLSPQALSNTIWALATLGSKPDDKFLDWLKMQAIMSLEQFSPQSVCNILFGFALLECSPGDDLVLGLQIHATNIIKDFDSHSIANILRPFAILGIEPHDFFLSALDEHTIWLFDEGKFRQKDFVIFLLACARLGRCPPGSVVAHIMDMLDASAPTLSAQQISSSLWAMGALKIQPPDTLLKLLEDRSLEVIDDVIPQGFANTLWAYSRFRRVPGRTWIRLMGPHATNIMEQFNAHTVCMTLVNLIRIDVLQTKPDPRLLVALQLRAIDCISEFDYIHLVDLTWALGWLPLQVEDGLMEAIETKFIDRLQHGNAFKAADAEVILHSFKMEGISLDPLLEQSLWDAVDSIGLRGKKRSRDGTLMRREKPSQEMLTRATGQPTGVVDNISNDLFLGVVS